MTEGVLACHAGPGEPAFRATSVGEVLREAAMDSPDRPALVDGAAEPHARRRWTYKQLLRDAERCAYALLGRYEPGDRIAIWAPNIAEYQFLQYGCALAGMTMVTVNPAFREPEARYVLERSGAVACFAVRTFRGRPLLDTARAVSMSVPSLVDVVAFEDWDGFLASASGGSPLPAVNPWSAAQILYTSGTTGAPKGAMLPHVGMTNNVAHAAQRIAAGADQAAVWLAALPMFHLAGCVVAALGSVALRGTLLTVRDFEAGLALRLIEEEGVTTMNLVPTMMLAMLQHDSFTSRDLSSVRSIMLGGGPVSPALARRLEAKLGVVTIVGYGMTEAAVITMTSRFDAPEDRATTCGLPLPGVEVRVVDRRSGATLRCGETGEAQTRGPHTMLGYFDNDEANASTFTGDGWMRTGDLCSLDERGYLRVQGRVKEMIIRGGENVYPREIEDALLQEDATADVAVIGLPDDYYGEVVAAFVQLRPGFAASVAELSQRLRARLAGYKVPTRWFFVDSYPKTPSGKIKKAELRERWEQGAYPEATA